MTDCPRISWLRPIFTELTVGANLPCDAVCFTVCFILCCLTTGLDASCLGFSDLHSRLLFVTLVPPICVVLIVLVVWLRHWDAKGGIRTLLPALEPSIIITFLIFPSAASFAFRVIGACECFTDQGLDGTSERRQCFSYVDFSIRCPITSSLDAYLEDSKRALALVAIMIYAVAIPVFFGTLLLMSRRAILLDKYPTALSEAVHSCAPTYSTVYIHVTRTILKQDSREPNEKLQMPIRQSLEIYLNAYSIADFFAGLSVTML